MKKTSAGAGHKDYDLILTEYPKPKFDPAEMKNHVLVRVKAAAMNPIDCKVLVSMKPLADFPRVGRDFAGIIEQVGQGITDLKVGDEIWGASCPAMQEYLICNSDHVSKKPANITMEEAAGIGVTYVTSYDALFAETIKKDRPPITKDTKVLIIGAAGGTGISGCQLAKNCAQARLVVGVCSGQNGNLVKQNGADVVMDHRNVDFKGLTNAPKEAVLEQVKKHLETISETVLTKEERDNFDGFDLVYDCVSSGEDFNYRPISHKLLNSNGHYVCINAASGLFWMRAILAARLPAFMSGIMLPGNEDLFLASMTRRKGDRLSKWFSEGKLKVNIFKSLSFNDNLPNYNDLYNLQMSRRASGKILLTDI